MESQIQNLKDQIPIVNDVMSHVMLTGIVLGLYLAVVIFLNHRKEKSPLVFFGWMVFCTSLISLDIHLCYTGWMKEVIFLNDSTETLVLLLGPFFYLFLLTAFLHPNVNWKKQWIHFLMPGLYFLTQIGFLIESNGVKFNAYISGFHPDLSHIDAPGNFLRPLYEFGKENLHELIILSFTVYSFLSIFLIKGRKNNTSIQHPLINKLAFSRNTIAVFLLLTIILTAVFILNDNDKADPYIVVVFTIFMILSNYLFTSSSRIFQKTWLNEKYHSSGMADHPTTTLNDITLFISQSGFALQQDITLQSLSDQLNIPATYISQAINSGLGINFNEYINRFRIEKAIECLKDPDFSHLNIEGIGKNVGFRSKSSFYAAFKKVTGSTPSAYIKA